jgi:hypothetical protein
VSQQVFDVNFTRGEEEDSGNQPVAVMRQIENQNFADQIRAWKRFSDISQTAPIGGLSQAIPIKRFSYDCRVFRDQLSKAALADYVHLDVIKMITVKTKKEARD